MTATPRDTKSAYLDVNELAKFVGPISVAERIDPALKLVRAASRVVDDFARRFFYQLESTYCDLDVLPGQSEWITPWDMLDAPTQLLVDTNLDGTYSTDMTSLVNVITLGRNPPYYGFEMRIVQVYLPLGNKRLRVKADWGWPRVADLSGQTVANGGGLSNSGTSLQVAASSALAIGQTIRIDSEQLYLTDLPDSTHATVERGANGTTAVAHAAATAIYILRYEPRIYQATGMIASRLWKRRDTAYAAVISDHGPTIEPSGLIDRDLTRILAPLRKRSFG
jgi:hypothetical protein